MPQLQNEAHGYLSFSSQILCISFRQQKFTLSMSMELENGTTTAIEYNIITIIIIIIILLHKLECTI